MSNLRNGTPPIKVAGPFGIYQTANGRSTSGLWGVIEVVTSDGLWIEYPCALSKEQAIARCHELYSKEPPC